MKYQFIIATNEVDANGQIYSASALKAMQEKGKIPLRFEGREIGSASNVRVVENGDNVKLIGGVEMFDVPEKEFSIAPRVAVYSFHHEKGVKVITGAYLLDVSIVPPTLEGPVFTLFEKAKRWQCEVLYQYGKKQAEIIFNLIRVNRPSLADLTLEIKRLTKHAEVNILNAKLESYDMEVK